MCGRYNIIPDADAWSEAFSLSDLSETRVAGLPNNYNVCPSTEVPIIRLDSGTDHFEMDLVRWGLIPFWAKDKAIGYKMINARSETVAVKPAYRSSYRKRRCVIPANGFYEWKNNCESGGKQPYLIRMKDNSVFGFAGLWERWESPHEKCTIDSCTIVTTQANLVMQQVHDRMPVILGKEQYAEWLDPHCKEPGLLLKSCPSDWIDAQPVSRYVNNPRHNDNRCIAVEPRLTD